MNAALKLALLSLLVVGPTYGSEVEIGTEVVVCNTQKQVEEFVAFNESDPRTAIRAINDEEKNPAACGVADLAFVRIVTLRTRNATFQVTAILVIGLVTEDGMQSVTPTVQFSLFKIDERPA
jgi:hypothetical protein